MITLHTWSTPNGRKVSIALEELELEYRVVPIDISKDKQFEPSFLKLNPNNKIPVIEDDDGPGKSALVLFESGAILIYLAEKCGRLLPREPIQRYHALQWLMFQMGGVGPMFGQTHHFRRFAAGEKYPLERFQRETHRIYRVLESRLGEARFLSGSEYTIADIATFPWVARFDLHNIEWSEFPNVKRWFDEIGDRPAVQRGMKVPS